METATVLGRERALYEKAHPLSLAAARRPSHLLSGVPMTWMAKWAGGFPLVFDRARGATVTDIDGNEYADFCLGDTGAMAGHSPAPTVAAVRRRADELGGLATMMPSEDAAPAAALLAERFGLPAWSFTLTATDANRWAIRIARHVTRRPKILVFHHCYHGSVDETVVGLEPDGSVVAAPGSVGPPVDLGLTTRVVEFNDLEALIRELGHGDVACVLMEPALTNIGIVLPEARWLGEVREAVTAAGALLIVDETHTFSAGPGGCTAAWGLEPDIITIGKAIGGGVPVGAYGLSGEVAAALTGSEDADLVDVGGVGGTLAGNPVSTAAVRATLADVLTPDAFEAMIGLCDRFVRGARDAISSAGLEWVVVQLGARAEYRYAAVPPRNGAESAAAADDALDEYLHLYLANRGVLLTPFHNMVLMSPATSRADVDRLVDAFAAATAELSAGG